MYLNKCSTVSSCFFVFFGFVFSKWNYHIITQTYLSAKRLFSIDKKQTSIKHRLRCLLCVRSHLGREEEQDGVQPIVSV